MKSPEELADGVGRACVEFCRRLRDAGFGLTATAAADLMLVARVVGIDDKARFFHAARGLLTHDRRQWDLFEALFHAFWQRPTDAGDFEVQRPAGRGLEPIPPRLPGAPSRLSSDPGVTPQGGGTAFGARPLEAEEDDRQREEVDLAASWTEARRGSDLRRLSPAELTSALGLVGPARHHAPLRTTRRSGPGPEDVRFDLRRTIRQAARTDWEFADLSFRDLRRERRRILLLCDASRSMRTFTRAILGLSYALRAALTDVEVFLFATRLTRVTHLLGRRSPESVLQALQIEVRDWGGGTRIGSALAEFNRQWTKRALTSRAVVVLLTDGLDAGDPAELAAEGLALRRRCWRLVWLNPLAGGPGFEPRAGGMRALLPAVDVMLPCRDLQSLVGFLEVIGQFRGWRDVDPLVSRGGAWAPAQAP